MSCTLLQHIQAGLPLLAQCEDVTTLHLTDLPQDPSSSALAGAGDHGESEFPDGAWTLRRTPTSPSHNTGRALSCGVHSMDPPYHPASPSLAGAGDNREHVLCQGPGCCRGLQDA
jgi:hypothetical protein